MPVEFEFLKDGDPENPKLLPHVEKEVHEMVRSLHDPDDFEEVKYPPRPLEDYELEDVWEPVFEYLFMFIGPEVEKARQKGESLVETIDEEVSRFDHFWKDGYITETNLKTVSYHFLINKYKFRCWRA